MIYYFLDDGSIGTSEPITGFRFNLLPEQEVITLEYFDSDTQEWVSL